METLNNLQKGNKVTQRNTFLIIAAIIVMVVAILALTHKIDLSALNN